ncbi:MAG: hypothetical protein Q9168_006550 [Polycauliona sp. 1 TL-2023]
MSSPAPPSPNGDENRQGGILVTTFVVTVLASVLVAFRMATRIWIVKNVGWDDYTILFATIGIVIGCGLVVVQVHYGLGRHKIYLSADGNDFLQFTKYAYIEWIQTFQTLMFTKLSICFLLLRIPVEKYLIRPIQGAIVFLIVSNIVLTLLWILQCNPVEGAWNKELPASPQCFTDAQLQRIIISQAIISIISDFALALFPIVLLWKVQIPIRVKVGLCTLMSLGLITAACCLVRTIGNWQNVNSDPTWASVNNWYWRSWEVSLGIIAACIPPLRPGYKAMTSGINSYLSHRSSRKSSSGTLVDTEKSSEPTSVFAKIFHGGQASHESGVEAAAHAVDVEANRAQVHGAGDDDFAMQNLPGDKKTRSLGIQKTTTIDIEDRSASGSRRDLSADEGKGEKTRDFI